MEVKCVSMRFEIIQPHLIVAFIIFENLDDVKYRHWQVLPYQEFYKECVFLKINLYISKL